MTTLEDDIRLASTLQDSAAFSRLRAALLSRVTSPYLHDAVVVYLERAPVVDWAVAEKFVRFAADPLVAAMSISAAAIRGCPSLSFWTALEEVAVGESWDVEFDARIQAILALNRRPGGCTVRVKEILRKGLIDPSAVVRDSSAIAAQRCYGIPEPNIVTGGEEGTLVERIDKSIQAWLQSR